MRTKPHSTFWGWLYAGLYFLQNGWPAWAGASAGAFFFLAAGRAARPDESGAVYLVALAAFGVCVLVLLFGGRRIEHTLEILNWVMVSGVFLVLTALCLAFAGPASWWAAAVGFFGFDAASGSFRFVPEGADWFLVGAFAAFSGCGGRHEPHALELVARQGLRDGLRGRLHPDHGGRAGGAARPHGQRVRADPVGPRDLAGVVADREDRPVGRLLRGSPHRDGPAGHPLHGPHPPGHRPAGRQHRLRARAGALGEGGPVA